ncbi:MAG: hypothetical protein JXJ17_18425 [Anaerolineae bacterium]|nr:hypothetical protein [Anaerolineae bacterium]
MDPKNPFNLCTWKPESACEGCQTGAAINCRHSWADLLRFYLYFSLFGVPAIIGVIRAGYGLWLWGWLGYAVFFFFIWESRILCSHCPYYAENSLVLHCLANHGVLKIWRYHPEPMSRFEQWQFMIGAGILVLYPFLLMILGGEWLFAALTAAVTVIGSVLIYRTICSRCINFSCPANHVPKQIVDAYLMRNPVMREAWERTGYVIED